MNLLAPASLFVAIAIATAHAGTVGYRGNGSGVFPDAKPPTEFDAVTGKNLRWKVALPNHSNSSPIVVGDRVFVVCAAGWPEGQDCAQLLCFDAATGKELWRRDVDEFAMRPAEEAKAAREVRAEYHRRIRLLNNGLFAYHQTTNDTERAALVKQAEEIGVKSDPYKQYSWGTGSAEQVVMRSEFGKQVRKVCGYETITWSPTCLDMNMPTPVSDGKRVYVVTGRRTAHAFDLDGNVVWQVWQPDAPYSGHYPEDLANAPWVVEGKLLMYAFDHLWAWDTATGKLAWKAPSKFRFRHGMGTPVLLNLPVPGQPGATDAFLYLWTGDLVRVRDGKTLQKDLMYAFFGSMTTDRADTLFISTMPENCVEHTNLTRAGHKPQLPPHGKARTAALRFAYADPDTVTWTEVWTNQTGLGSNPIFHEHRLYTAGGGVLDARTGNVTVKAGRDEIGRNGFILAGNHLYGLPLTTVGWPRANTNNTETVNVVRVKPADGAGRPTEQRLESQPRLITDPVQLKKVVAMTGFQYHKSDYGWYTAASAPFAAGNRLYVRTFDYLYCFEAR
jgi:outer membrane protein assembly factor BamB